jgi:hypothetical protein
VPSGRVSITSVTLHVLGRASVHASSPLPVPFVQGTSGPSLLIMASQKCYSGAVLPESSCSQASDHAVPPVGLRSGMVPGLGTKVVGHPVCAGIPSRRRLRRSRPGASSPTRRDIRFGAAHPASGQPRLHPSLHQRPRTAGNVLGHGSDDEVTSWPTVDSSEALPMTMDHMA